MEIISSLKSSYHPISNREYSVSLSFRLRLSFRVPPTDCHLYYAIFTVFHARENEQLHFSVIFDILY